MNHSVAAVCHRALLCICVCAGLWLPESAGASLIRGVVTRVTDGDTVWVQPEGSATAPLKLRMLGIDAPERCQPWGGEATAALTERVLHRPVTIDTRPSYDRHGRLLGRLQLGAEDIGAWMVQQGHAWSYRYRGDLGPYASLEQRARTQKSGLFMDGTPEEPSAFRKRHGACPR